MGEDISELSGICFLGLWNTVFFVHFLSNQTREEPRKPAQWTNLTHGRTWALRSISTAHHEKPTLTFLMSNLENVLSWSPDIETVYLMCLVTRLHVYPVDLDNPAVPGEETVSRFGSGGRLVNLLLILLAQQTTTLTNGSGVVAEAGNKMYPIPTNGHRVKSRSARRLKSYDSRYNRKTPLVKRLRFFAFPSTQSWPAPPLLVVRRWF